MASINQFQIVSNGVLLDSYDDLDFSFTYQIGDIEDITSKKSSFSKTILLPGTKTNQEYFKQIQDINIDISNTSYNPKKSLPVEVKINDESIFKGNIQLLNIITNQKQVDFEVVITGVFKNIMISFSDYYLNQLDLSEYDHIRNVQNIINSYDNVIFVNGVQTSSQVGEGYTYPMIINGQSQVQLSNVGVGINAIDLNPAIYVKTIMDKLFQFAGFTYSSNFFNSPYFKSLIMPLDSPQYTSTDVENRIVRVGINSNQLYSYPITGIFPQPNSGYFISAASTLGGLPGVIPISPALQKANSWWSNTSNGKWWMNFNRETGSQGNIVFQDNNNQWSTNYLGQNICSYVNQVAGFYSIDLNLAFNPFFVHKTGANFRWLSGQLSYVCRIYKVSTSGQLSIIAQTGTQPFTPSSTALLPSPYLDPQTRSMDLNANNVWLNAGEQVRVMVQFYYPTNVSWQSVSDNVLFQAVVNCCNPQANYLEIKPATTINYSINTPLPITDMLPSMKMKDLFLDVVKMFNLMVYDDPNTPNNLIIEPRDEFFESKPRVKDWTYKLDYNSDIIQTPMSELDVKSYYFTYKGDKDYYNTQYNELTGKVYGEYEIDFLNDFSTEEKKLELSLSPSLNTDNFISNSNLVAPFFCDIDANQQLSPIKVNPRILFSKKISNAPRPYFLRNAPGQPTTNMSSYMYCGMYDDPYNPNHTLEFQNSGVLYYNTSLCCPNNTLINEFYLSTLNDLTDVNSKLLEGYFHLTPSDINDFDFRDTILIDNSYWRVNTIVDYNPNAIDKLTKVILYKLNYLDIFFNDNKNISESEVDCPNDIVAKPQKGGGYIYVSLSNQPLTEACCDNVGGIWSNGKCLATITPGTPLPATGGSTSPSSNTTTGKVVPQTQVKSGSVYNERPQQLLKNQNVNNSNTVIIAGSNNFVDFGVNNGIIVGENNSISSDITNSIIVGDGITNAPSNSIVVGDILINTDGMRYLNPYIIEGGYEEVMDVSKTNLIDIVDAGNESVRPFGGDSKLRPIIDGSEPPIV